MSIAIPSPSALNFLAGLFAGAGINMLTSVSTGPPDPEISTLKVALDSALWVIAAAFLTWAAHLLEAAEREADLYIAKKFNEAEKKELRQEYRSRALRRARLPLVLTGLSLVSAVLLLPGLIGWHRVLGG
ncbi:hypothetical protein C1I95_24300 [Micromonospora craterilacus]|uniref:Uncharacterized protein n=1 Tax=Micromonospora craterilacus TaxID=1655439 RepID=A0A2W2E8V7_9ACTN|nr:hypothetical protein [Micromonospora craterilacus]PZG13159.1 hypothetical protein C1I95_24300 [Micromonospora craterilacus]